MKCIKCGREIPDGDLFCLECSLTPAEQRVTGEAKPPAGASARAGGDRGGARAGAQSRGSGGAHRTQAEKRPASGAVATAARPVQQAAASKQVVVRKAPKGLIFAFILVLALLVGVVGYCGYRYSEFQTQKANLRVKEADLTLRETELETLKKELKAKEDQLQAAEDEIQALRDEIDQLTSSLDGSASSLNQTQYDMTTQQQELKRWTDENAELLSMVESLEKDNGTLQQSVSELTARNAAYSEKVGFMDAYVVFVENDGTNLYHKYGCSRFAKKSFWAYSTKLAESNGYTPCPICN